MTLKRNLTFTGVPYEETRPDADVLAQDIDTIAGDDANTWETLTGLNADGTASPSVIDPHRHLSPDHMRLWRPFWSKAWGDSNAESEATGAESLSVVTVKDTTGTKSDPTVIEAVLVHFNNAWVNHFIEMLATGSSTDSLDELGVTVVVTDDTMTEVYRGKLLIADDVDGIDNGGQFLHRFLFTVPLAGLYVIRWEVDIVDEDRSLTILQGSLAPTFRFADRDKPQPNDTPVSLLGGNVATVPSGWRPVDSRLTAADFPLGPALVLCAQNQNLLFERGTGLPAPGNTDRTEDPHDHDGVNSAGLSYNVLSLSFGANEDDAEISGNQAKAPYVDSTAAGTPTTLREIREVFVQLPKSGLTVGGVDSKLRVAVLAHCATAGTGKLQCFVISETDAALATGCRFTQTTTGLQVLKTVSAGVTSMGFTSAAMEKINISIQSTVPNPSAKPRLMAVCLYFEE